MDIKERRHAQNEEKALDQVIDQLDEALVWISPEGKILKVNRTAVEKTGYPHKRIMSMEVSELCEKFTLREWKDHVNRLSVSTMGHFECGIRTNLGLVRPMSVKTHLVRGEDQNYICAIAKDLGHTERTAEHIERMIYEYNMLNYRLSHDLRSPISTILGLINLAKIDCSPQQQEYLFMMESTLQKQNSLMKNMYQLTSIHTADLHHETINFPEFFNNLILEVPVKWSSPEWEFHFGLNRRFACDQGMLINLLLPIVINASQFSRDKAHPCVNIRVKTDEIGVIIEIRDNGEGISDVIRHHVFEMFFRGSSRSEGSGLGLYLSKSAAKRLNASVNFETSKEGTNFIVRIPSH